MELKDFFCSRFSYLNSIEAVSCSRFMQRKRNQLPGMERGGFHSKDQHFQASYEARAKVRNTRQSENFPQKSHSKKAPMPMLKKSSQNHVPLIQ